MASRIKLYMFPGSNSVLTTRLMLEYKGLEYDTVTLMPGAHAFIMLGLGFQTMGVPAVKIDGRRVQGTRWIARALDDVFPGRPLFPADPARRKAVEDVERWGERFQNATRRIFYCAARRDHAAFASVMAAQRGPVARAVLRAGAPMLVRLAGGAHRASDNDGREDLELLIPDGLDQIDAWIAEGLLGGADPNAADFQIAVNVAAWLIFDDLAPFVDGRPAAALARRVVGDYGGHLPPLLPAEWLSGRTASPAAGAIAATTDHEPPAGLDAAAIRGVELR